MVTNPPANVGDTGLIPDLGRSHRVAEILSLCATTVEPVFCSLGVPTTEPTCPNY